jgi:hypothetical protein
MISGVTELGREKREEWAESLATGEKEVLCDLGQIGVICGGRFQQTFLDSIQLFPNSGNIDKTLEVFHWCRWYYETRCWEHW